MQLYFVDCFSSLGKFWYECIFYLICLFLSSFRFRFRLSKVPKICINCGAHAYEIAPKRSDRR